MKKMILLSAVLSLFVFAPTVSAQTCISASSCPTGQDCVGGVCVVGAYGSSDATGYTAPSSPGNTSNGFTALAPIPGLTDPGATQNITNGKFSFGAFFNQLYNYLIGVAVILAIIMIIWSGIEIATNKDNVSKILDSKGRIYNALFGLVLVLAPALVFGIINPSITKFSLNLSNVDLSIASTTPPGVVPDPSGCTITGAAGILQFAACPSTTAADTWGQKNCPAPALLEKVTTPPNLQNNAGTIATVTCTYRNIFDFVNVGDQTFFGLVPDQLWPLAVTSNSQFLQGSETVYQTNGSDAIQFANICQSVGLETCVNHAPKSTSSHACLPEPQTTAPASAPKPLQCYTEQVSCESGSGLDYLYCVTNPSWEILH